jgi:large subunit ribosomal protein L13
LKTYSAKAGEIQRNWWLVNADGLTLGRLSTKLAMLLQGKNKPVYTPHIDTGDFVVVVNAHKLSVSGNKLEQKVYYRHSGFPGGQKAVLMRDLMSNHPDRVLRHAVRGMLPKNRLGRAQLKKLKIYAGVEHPHEAQQPQVLEF